MSADVNTPAPTLDEFREEARSWLAGHATSKPAAARAWGEGSDHVPVWHNLSLEDERAAIDRLRAWRRTRFDAGYGAIGWDPAHGGRGLPPAYELAYVDAESDFEVPASHEAVAITTDLIAPTIRTWGTPEQHARHLRPMLRGDELWCQLFSEPGAGSDVAGLRTRAVPDGDEWVLHGQKVWTSGAKHSSFGYLLARTDASVPKHQGITAFVVPMGGPGVEVRPIRQMSGGSSFNEVFFDGVRVSDADRLGPVGGGWRVAMTTLGFERVAGSGEGGDLVRRFELALGLARHLHRAEEPVVRQRLATAYAFARISDLNSERARAAWSTGQTPGPEGSVGKLFYSHGLAAITDAVSLLLGPRLTADTGEWGTYAWTEHVTGVPGARLAGGTDEIQRNVLGERILGLPGEPRPDREVPFAAGPGEG